MLEFKNEENKGKRNKKEKEEKSTGDDRIVVSTIFNLCWENILKGSKRRIARAAVKGNSQSEMS